MFLNKNEEQSFQRFSYYIMQNALAYSYPNNPFVIFHANIKIGRTKISQKGGKVAPVYGTESEANIIRWCDTGKITVCARIGLKWSIINKVDFMVHMWSSHKQSNE